MTISAGSFNNPDFNNFQQEIIHQTPIPIFVVEGAEFIITLSNEKNLEKWQRTHEEVLGKPLFDVFPEGKTQPFVGFLSEVYHKGISIKRNEEKAEFYHNGVLDTAWFDIQYQPIKNEKGEVHAIMAISVDVTSQVLARQKAEEREKEFRQMTDAIPHFVWVADSEGKVIFYNKRIYEYSGLDKNIDKDSLWNNIIHPEDVEETTKSWQDALINKTLYSVQHRLKAKDGQYRWFLSRAFFEEDTENKTAHWFGSATDIDEQKQIELTIIQEKEFSRSVFESSPDCLKVIDANGRIQHMNFNGQCLMEIDNFNEFKNKQWSDFWGNENHILIENSIQKALSGETVQFKAQAQTAKGTLKWWDVMISPVNNIQGEIREIIATSRDITEEKISEDTLKESEEKYRSLFETMDQGFCIVEVIFDADQQPVDYRFLEYNLVFENHTGLTNVMGRTVLEIIPNIEKFWIETYGNVALTGKSIRLINESKAINRWFEVYAFNVGDAQNNRVAILFTDISENKKSEQALKASEEKFRILTETIPQMAWMSDEKGNPEYLSSQWEKYAGLMPMNEYWGSICHPDDIENSMINWNKSIATCEKLIIEARLKNQENEYRWHVSVGVPLRNDQGEVMKWIGSVTDIHDQKMKEQQKDEFISIASHEMKTPLTSAKAYLQLMEMTLDENHDAYLYTQKANHAVGRLHNLITELLDASKIQHGKLNYTHATFDFDAMMAETIENIQYSSTTHTIIKQGNIKKKFLGDKDRLQQVVINLLTNAVKYSPEANQVEVRIQEENSHLQVSVTDKGVGMPEKHLKRIFERYYRVEEHAIQFQGLGIGLYISYDIVMRHGGKMWVESILGEGSTFHFTLPYVN
ncbi:MAG: PAS domain S-box protein [Arcicella sp.]|nr:PAS domain S-box protein [Arcicella sp.]